MNSLAVTVVLLIALLRSCLAQFAGNPDLCCAALAKGSIDDRTAFPGSAAYNEFRHSYYAINSRLYPTCIIQPLSAQDVSVAVKILTNSYAGPCFFAVRSGGHTSNVGAANIEPGVTIDLSLMNRTTYNPSTGTASIQAGARWGSVYETLQPDNVTVPGGRTWPIGVGGYLTGGGISFYIGRVGIACDSIENYEVVLASGEIVNVNRHSSSDLFKALKGGSNNFGIVTTFDMAALPVGDIWGGEIVHNISHTLQYISAATEFTDNIPSDPSAAWLGYFIYNSNMGQTIISSTMVYTRPVARPAAFNMFYQIPNITDTLKFTTIVNKTKDIDVPYRFTGQTGTYLNRAEVMLEAVKILSKQIRIAKSLAQGKDFRILLVFQPWVPLFWKDSKARGGNVLGLERFHHNMINIVWDYFWDNKTDDSLFYQLAQSGQQELDQYARSTGTYNEFVYLNYADSTQNPLRGYGPDNVEFMRQVAKKYDPEGVFQRLVPGGFKISKV
ncbi:FAD-binding domain-containing protein [Aspergillus ellipticus CBS 707.79]|uniref:FAD-binding domain-containing protein n=1 Tax=Aspergillus ellipticus CBS 707.79 TaxID=1448320 RepID=A0A319CZD0_9EURO|nr:FAD-binding domain-containing protein [Aspergillus ellipticus CBS 707.79]